MFYNKKSTDESDSSRHYIHIIRIIEVFMVAISAILIIGYICVKPDFLPVRKKMPALSVSLI